jgi:hypothetical protein
VIVCATFGLRSRAAVTLALCLLNTTSRYPAISCSLENQHLASMEDTAARGHPICPPRE